jgi:plasmid maintenance system antidote protein VapI
MKFELGRCLLHERLVETGMTKQQLAHQLQYRPERIDDFIEKKRVMSLQVAVSVADTLGCGVRDLYEFIPAIPYTNVND